MPNSVFNKTDFLNRLEDLLKTEQISQEEVQQTIQKTTSNAKPKPKKNFSNILIKIFGALGGIITLLGIIFFVNLIWEQIGDVGQILVTFGLGLVFFVSATMLDLSEIAKAPKFVSNSLHLIGAFLIPTGIFVILSKMPSSEVKESLVVFLIFLILAGVYALTDYFAKSRLLTTAVYIFASISYSASVSLIADSYRFNDPRFFSIFGIIYALPLMLLPRVMELGFREKVYRFFEGFGYFVFFVSVFQAGAGDPLEILALLVYLGGILLGTKLQSATILAHSFIATTMFILYINFTYFANLITWPLALILSGLILILSGYGFSRLKG